MFTRWLQPPKSSFFLFGPRATGKSSWLRTTFTDALYVDLLRNDTYFTLLTSPETLRAQVLAQPRDRWTVIDEVQRVPALLDEVHALIAERGSRFALSGSSARKLKRGQANLLAGRALMHRMFPLVIKEYGDAVTVEDVLQFGTLPQIIAEPGDRIARLESYASTYLREEIKEEALTRRIDAFGRFLEVAALMNGQVTNLASLSRDAHIARATADSYLEILEDTMIGSRLSAWTPRVRVKEVAHPKFYFFDCGVVRAIQGRLRDRPTAEEAGSLLETYLFHELNAAMSHLDVGGSLHYWRTADGVEVDFIWRRGAHNVAIEVKATKRWRPSDDMGMAALTEGKAKITGRYGVFLGEVALQRDWGQVLPLAVFLQRLQAGEILGGC